MRLSRSAGASLVLTASSVLCTLFWRSADKRVCASKMRRLMDAKVPWFGTTAPAKRAVIWSSDGDSPGWHAANESLAKESTRLLMSASISFAVRFTSKPRDLRLKQRAHGWRTIQENVWSICECRAVVCEVYMYCHGSCAGQEMSPHSRLCNGSWSLKRGDLIRMSWLSACSLSLESARKMRHPKLSQTTHVMQRWQPHSRFWEHSLTMGTS